VNLAKIHDSYTTSGDTIPTSSVRWLWYLRRLPAEFFGGIYVTTIGYDRGLAESLTWFSTGGDADNSDKQVNFRIDDSAIRHVCRYVAAVKVLSHLQIAYRRVGKGASLDTRKRIPFAASGSLQESTKSSPRYQLNQMVRAHISPTQSTSCAVNVPL